MVRNHPCAILDSKSKDIFSQSDFTNFNSGNIDFKLLKVVNQSPTKKNITINCQAFSVDSKLVAFGDQRGNIHILNLEYNKYWCVKTRGISITAIAFVSTRIVVAATSDKAVLSYDIKTSICVAKMFDFTTEPIIIFDSHPSKPLLICNSGSEAVLLNTNDWNKQKSLDIENGSIKFRNSHLCGRFNDCIFFWDEDDFSLSYKIEDLGDGLNLFDVSSNGQLLVYSLGSVLYVYDIERQIIEHNLDIQNLHVCAKIEFIRGSYIACALAEGIITFVDCSKGKIVNKLRGRHPFRNFSISNCGKYLITTSSTSRHAANMFHVEKLLLTRGNTENRVIDSNPSSIQKEQITDSNPIIEPRTNPDMGTNPQTFSQLLESTPEFSLLKRSDLKQFLNKYGQYPNDYRPLIWKTLLKLPENRRIFESLLNKGLHSAWLHFRTKYPLKSDQDSKILKAVLSCLEHWCPGISEIEFIPAMVFPLSKMHKHDLITMFETIVFFIYNYSDWFGFKF